MSKLDGIIHLSFTILMWRKEMQTPFVVVRLESRKQTWLQILTMKGCNVGNKMFTKPLGGLQVWAFDWASRNDSQNTAELTHQGHYHLWGHRQGYWYQEATRLWSPKRLENGFWWAGKTSRPYFVACQRWHTVKSRNRSPRSKSHASTSNWPNLICFQT